MSCQSPFASDASMRSLMAGSHGADGDAPLDSSSEPSGCKSQKGTRLAQPKYTRARHGNARSSLIDISELSLDLDFNRLYRGEQYASLTPYMAEAMHVLISKWPAPVPTDRIIARIYGQGEEPGDAYNVWGVTLYKMRRRILPLAVRVIYAWQLGFYVEVSPLNADGDLSTGG